MEMLLVPTLYEYVLSDTTDNDQLVSKADAGQLFSFFNNQSLFRWKDAHNGCEARADAICILLNEWQIPHYKAWVFSGWYLKNNTGGLIQQWKYHVAPVLPVQEAGHLVWYIIDPATASCLQTMHDWAAGVTAYPHSYHFIRQPHWYIFHQNNIAAGNWMIQGLAGINALSGTGKAALCFNKTRLKNTARAFKKLKKQSPL
jgi:hypothetical protein